MGIWLRDTLRAELFPKLSEGTASLEVLYQLFTVTL